MEPDFFYFELFKKEFKNFKRFVEEKSGTPLNSIGVHPYVQRRDQEGYKVEVFERARVALDFRNWREKDIGTGNIRDHIIRALKEDYNLVYYQTRSDFGRWIDKYQPLHELERTFYNLYWHDRAEEFFNFLGSEYGHKFGLLAYFLFIHDKERFLPISPQNFEQALRRFGISLQLSHNATWENYLNFIEAIKIIRRHLSFVLNEDVSLLDAHSFAWMVHSQIHNEEEPEAVSDQTNLTYKTMPLSTEIRTSVLQRNGQDFFRAVLLKIWQAQCAVTGLKIELLLEAAHIKPWRFCTPEERIDTNNGLLLHSGLHKCFDAGLIAFDERGCIILGRQIDEESQRLLGIGPDMKIKGLKDEHLPYLKYHRDCVFKR